MSPARTPDAPELLGPTIAVGGGFVGILGESCLRCIPLPGAPVRKIAIAGSLAIAAQADGALWVYALGGDRPEVWVVPRIDAEPQRLSCDSTVDPHRGALLVPDGPDVCWVVSLGLSSVIADRIRVDAAARAVEVEELSELPEDTRWVGGASGGALHVYEPSGFGRVAAGARAGEVVELPAPPELLSTVEHVTSAGKDEVWVACRDLTLRHLRLGAEAVEVRPRWEVPSVPVVIAPVADGVVGAFRERGRVVVRRYGSGGELRWQHPVGDTDEVDGLATGRDVVALAGGGSVFCWRDTDGLDLAGSGLAPSR